MKSFFALVRWKNLLIIAFTMIAMREFIFVPVFKYYGLSLVFPIYGFYCLVLATILVAASGYVINDYYDMRTDRINKASKMIVGTKISRRKAIGIHLWLNVVAVVAGIVATIAFKHFWLILIIIAASLFLWLYSLKLKNSIFWGNLVIAILTGVTPLLIGICEYVAVEDSLENWDINHIRAVKMSVQVVVAFSIFAFIYTLIREIIKDCEDISGDKKNNITTMPVAIGLKKTNFIIAAISVVALLVVAGAWYVYLSKTDIFKYCSIAAIYLHIFILVPTLYLIVRSLIGTSKTKYTRLSILAKIIMVFGLIFTLLFSYIIYKNGII